MGRVIILGVQSISFAQMQIENPCFIPDELQKEQRSPSFVFEGEIPLTEEEAEQFKALNEFLDQKSEEQKQNYAEEIRKLAASVQYAPVADFKQRGVIPPKYLKKRKY